MSTKYIEIETEESWLEMRTSDVTSTESAALFGLSPYMTEMELFYRKQAGVVVTFDDNARMKAGRYLEPSIAELAGDELGCTVEPFKRYARNDDRMGSSFDFIITSGELNDWILEIKNVDFLVYRDKWEDDEAPDHIEVQVQHQLELTDKPGAIIACLVGGNDLRLIKRERNPKMGAGIRKRINKFWSDIEANNPPEPDFARDAEFIISLHQASGQEILVVEPDDDIATLLAEYRRIKREAKDLEDVAKARKAEMLTLIGDSVSKVISGNLSLSCGMTKDTEPNLITEAMIGQSYGGRRGYRQFTVREKKGKL